MATSVPAPLSAGRAQAEAAFLEANPSFRDTAVVDELRASDYARLDVTGDVYLDYTGGSLYAASSSRRTRVLRDTRLRQPALRQPDVVGRDGARRAGARRRAALVQRARGRVRLHLHRRTPPAP